MTNDLHFSPIDFEGYRREAARLRQAARIAFFTRLVQALRQKPQRMVARPLSQAASQPQG